MGGVVFIDAQNVYKGAREAFGLEATSGKNGNVSPFRMGSYLARRNHFELEAVRVYTGVPHWTRDTQGHAITQRRIAAWRNESELVDVHERTLRYPPPKGREKGVDVQLAIDIVRAAADGACDVCVLCSADTDLAPALEFVDGHHPGILIITVAWKPIAGCERNTAAPLDLPSGRVTRVRLTKDEYDRYIADLTDYKTGTARA